jgi:hypothetical protein
VTGLAGVCPRLQVPFVHRQHESMHYCPTWNDCNELLYFLTLRHRAKCGMFRRHFGVRL